MRGQSKFRNSDYSLKTIQRLLSTEQLRNSLSNQSIPMLPLGSFRTTVSHTTVSQQMTQTNKPKRSSTLKQQLHQLQNKIAQARLHFQSNQCNLTKPVIKSQSPCKLDNQKSSGTLRGEQEELPKEWQKQVLNKFTNAQQKPSNVTSLKSNPYGHGRNNKYYLTEVVRARQQKNSLAIEHIGTSITILNSCLQTLQVQSYRQDPPIHLPKHPVHKKTLVLDLDETLIHCSQNSGCECDLTMRVTIESVQVNINLSIRPHALTFLKKMARKWQIIIFTASHQDYANAILDELDPDGVLFHQRLYRQHCSLINDMYVKDLSRLNRSLKDTVLVDNAAYSYSLQLDNGIPILPFYDGKDYELPALETYLDRLLQCDDVRQVNREYFKLDQYCQFETTSDLINCLYAPAQ